MVGDFAPINKKSSCFVNEAGASFLIRRTLLNKLIVLYNKYFKENLLSQLNVEDLLTSGHYYNET